MKGNCSEFVVWKKKSFGFMKSTLKIRLTSIIALLLFLSLVASFGSMAGNQVTILDLTHYSNVFGEARNYRVFLPPGYEGKPEKRYPVIYYYHGWSQRYFGSIQDFKADEGDSNGGDNIANFVANNDVIVVKPDGYNRRPDEDYYLRPYNIGPAETHRQFPLYFPELVSHIDANFRTVADRGHRAITGLSMGGFMTFWIGGKYPHLVCAAGNFCGSTEFVAGPKDFPVEYRHEEMYKNYEGMNVRLNYGDKDFIRAYHQDMNKVWTQVMDNYEFKIYDAAHSTAGLGEMFRFFMKTFENPPAKPARWHHADVYPSFSVWDYEVSSDRDVPGFTLLENVDALGFRCAVRSFLPDGGLMPFVNVSVTTPPVYEKNHSYQICDIDPSSGKSFVFSLKSDHEGRLKIDLDGGLHEVGFYAEGSSANLAVASFQVANMAWATNGKNIKLSVSLLNKGADTAKKISAQLHPIKESAVVTKDRLEFGDIASGTLKSSENTFEFIVKEDIEIVRFRVKISDGEGHEWSDFIDIQVKADGPELKDFVLADGKTFEVTAAGDDTVSVFLGNGNGDGIANPGESIVVLVKDQGRYFRALLHTSDPNINPAGINIRESDSWTTYDHVGASAKYSVPVLSSNCPQNHRVKFFAEYWLPDYPDHIIKRGTVEIEVKGKDQTAPELKWVKVLGDNTVQVKLYDGGEVSSVKAIFHLKDNPEKSFEVELKNEGEPGDNAERNLVFSRKIPEMGFGLYLVEIEAEDIFGNKMAKGYPGTFVVH
jgi:poly(3-hydroxybutyrate) depolymerase